MGGRGDCVYRGERGFSVTGDNCIGLLANDDQGGRNSGHLVASSHERFLSGKCCRPLEHTLYSAMRGCTTRGKGILSYNYNRKCCAGTITSILPLSSIFNASVSGSRLAITTGHTGGMSFTITDSFSLPFTSSDVSVLLRVFSPCYNARFGEMLGGSTIFVVIVPLRGRL